VRPNERKKWASNFELVCPNTNSLTNWTKSRDATNVRMKLLEEHLATKGYNVTVSSSYTYSGPSVIRIPVIRIRVRSGKFWVNYNCWNCYYSLLLLLYCYIHYCRFKEKWVTFFLLPIYEISPHRSGFPFKPDHPSPIFRTAEGLLHIL
jgi:hypothetical protein